MGPILPNAKSQHQWELGRDKRQRKSSIDCIQLILTSLQHILCSANVKKQPSQDVLHGDEAEEEMGLARLVSSYTLLHQKSQSGERGRQTARSKVLSRRARDT